MTISPVDIDYTTAHGQNNGQKKVLLSAFVRLHKEIVSIL